MAKQNVVVPAIAPLLERLEHKAGFWVGSALKDRLLREAGEA
jgi:predicted nucleic acid-binding protein